MSGVAATLNPLPVSTTSTVNQNVLLWYVTKKKQLGVDIHMLEGNSWSRYRDGGASLGAIRVSTSLASAVHNRTVRYPVLRLEPASNSPYSLLSMASPRTKTRKSILGLSPV